MGKILLGMVLGVVLLLIIGFVGVSNSHHTGSSVAPENVSEVAEPVAPVALAVTAPKLWSDYHANEVAADNIYKGKELLVQGTVAEIRKDFTDSIVVELGTFNEFENVDAGVKDDYQSEAASLHKGQIITVRCEGGGMVVGSPVLRGCSMQPNAQQQAEPRPQISNISTAPVAVTEPQSEFQQVASVATTPHDITTPVLISSATAEYTPEARANKVNGTVKLVLSVDEQGVPQDVIIAKSLGMGLDESAVNAVKHYRFKPAVDQQTGRAVPAQISVNVDFRLD